MCPGAGTSRAVLPQAAPESKRTLALSDPGAAAEQRADACALVPSPPPVAGEPINAMPLAARAPMARAEPPGLRAQNGLLAYLGLRINLPVHFIDDKTVTVTDVDPQQNRFRLPINAVMRNLRPILSQLDREASNLVHVGAPKPRVQKQLLPKVPGEKTKKRKGREHGGLPVLVIERNAGIRELQLTRWESSGVCVIKGEGYMDFINSSGFRVDDVVEIWAFKEKTLRLFGTDIRPESPLYVLLTKKVQMLPPPPPPPPTALSVVASHGDGGEEETAQDHAP
uniref:Uncharacterized protein n=1 Tax=Hordeum vulgare subsp. vulgare TaxID=112509 RepID=A0A8I6WFH2_HORVV